MTRHFWTFDERGFRALVLGALVVLSVPTLVACGGGGRFDGTTYVGDDVAFRLGPVPSGARQIESDEALVTFRDDQRGATIAVGARCGLDGDDVPLAALVGHLFIHFDERRDVRREEFRLDGREALEVELDASLDGVRRRFVVVVLKKDGCVYDFMHVDAGGEDPTLEASRRDFRTMVRGFSAVGHGSGGRS